MEAIENFDFAGEHTNHERCGSGHINDTFLITDKDAGEGKRYILQRMNYEIFRDPVSLMKNAENVTSFLREKIIASDGDPHREALNLVGTKGDGTHYVDSNGNYWRVYLFIGRATYYNLVEKPEDFYQSGEAFEYFQKTLADYPVKELFETTSNFHNTPVRSEIFEQAVKESVRGRAASVQEEAAFMMDRADDMGATQTMLEDGRLLLRVIHNDTELNNIMIDGVTGGALCIIGSDTIMPGLSIFDSEDSIRLRVNTAEEDETDLSKVSLSLPLSDIHTKGFLKGCNGSLTEMEVMMLLMGARLMTLECGIRFLTDHLQGDIYFKIHGERRNLDRTRIQFELVADTEEKWAKIEAIIEKYQ